MSGWALPHLGSAYESIGGNSYKSQESNYVLQLNLRKQLRGTNIPHKHLPPVVISESLKKILRQKNNFF